MLMFQENSPTCCPSFLCKLFIRKQSSQKWEKKALILSDEYVTHKIVFPDSLCQDGSLGELPETQIPFKFFSDSFKIEVCACRPASSAGSVS